MIADVARTLAGKKGDIWLVKRHDRRRETSLSILFRYRHCRERQKAYWWSVPLTWRYRIRSLAKICRCYENHPRSALYRRLWPRALRVSRNLAALASSEPTQQDLLAFLDDELTPNNREEQKRCAGERDLDGYKWDGLRDHTDIAVTTICGGD